MEAIFCPSGNVQWKALRRYVPPIISQPGCGSKQHTGFLSQYHHNHDELPPGAEQNDASLDEKGDETTILRLATAHFTSQALLAIVKLGIPDIMGDSSLTVPQLVSKMTTDTSRGTVSEHGILRVLRLLSNANIFHQEIKENEIYFSLTRAGKLLQTTKTRRTSLAPIVRHWMEPSLWNAWLELPNCLHDDDGEGGINNAFNRANGVDAPEFFKSHAESNKHRNEVASLISKREIPALLERFDWSQFYGKTIVDIGGGYGDLMSAVKEKHEQIDCYSLDLAHVVKEAPTPTTGIKLVSGDMFCAETIPSPCHAIVTKHVLCDWPDDDVVRMLQTCHRVLPPNGRVVIFDAVIVDGPAATDEWNLQTSIDVLLMLTGRLMDRSSSQWQKLAEAAGFVVESIQDCYPALSLNATVMVKR